MVAQLGDIVFEMLHSPGQIQETYRWDYAEHAVLDTKPHLQKMGKGLAQLSLTIRLSVSLGKDPQEVIDAFITEADKKTALPFILGNGKVMGEYVIEEIQKNWQRTDNTGSLLAAELSVRLKEYR